MKKIAQKPQIPFCCKARFLSVLLLMIMMALLLSGCGKGVDTDLTFDRAFSLLNFTLNEKTFLTMESAALAAAKPVHLHETDTPAPQKTCPLRDTPYGPEGSAGRLIIPSVRINVAVNLPGFDAQAVADAEDSACWMEAYGDLNPVIGDHVNQDFSSLFYIKPGDTCTITKNGRVHRYVCLSVGYGNNIETDVIDADGRSLFQYGDDRLCMYTCANGWQYVFIAEWQVEAVHGLHQRGSVIQQQFSLIESDF